MLVLRSTAQTGAPPNRHPYQPAHPQTGTSRKPAPLPTGAPQIRAPANRQPHHDHDHATRADRPVRNMTTRLIGQSLIGVSGKR
jgi:hypothetical protein